jgi:uncharacterized protein YihD (DUF1040 family)
LKTIDYIKVEARSESMNKWISRFEDEFGFESYGETPTKRMENLIEYIKSKINNDSDLAESINQLISSAFFVGAESGFDRALKRFQDGKITTRKVPNEQRWILHSNSSQYQITKELPSFDGTDHKATVYLSLSEFGFE